MIELKRREFLIVATGATAAFMAGVPAASASEADTLAAIQAFTGGASASDGGVTLEMPEIAENGNTVPLTIRVDSPMTAESYAKRVVVLADGNPNPGVITFHFSPLSGVAEASTRMRLAKTQNVVAVAEMSDGSFRKTQALVKVTIGGCGG